MSAGRSRSIRFDPSSGRIHRRRYTPYADTVAGDTLGVRCSSHRSISSATVPGAVSPNSPRPACDTKSAHTASASRFVPRTVRVRYRCLPVRASRPRYTWTRHASPRREMCPRIAERDYPLGITTDHHHYHPADEASHGNCPLTRLNAVGAHRLELWTSAV